MKLQLSIWAQDLSSAASYRAVVSRDGQELGQTAPSATTKDPVWNELILVDHENQGIDVVVYNDTNTEIVKQSFHLAEILDAPQKAVAKSAGGASKIGVHAQEQQDGQLQLVLQAKDLPDTDFGLTYNLTRQLTDPIFVIFAPNGRKICRSNLVGNSLNPTWDAVYLDLDELCGGDRDAPVRITVMDKDKGDATEYLGQVLLSVNQMLAQPAQPIQLIKYGQPAPGFVMVKQATLLPQQYVSRQAKKSLQAALGALSGLQEAQALAQTKTQAAQLAQEQAKTAQQQADDKQKQVETAAKKQEQVQTKLVDLTQAAQQATEAAQKQSCTGKLQIQLRAQDLPDTDGGIRIRNKTDPVYEVYSAGTANRVHRSNVVNNNLHPTWQVSTMDLRELCGGQLDETIRIAVYDKDGGNDKDYLGFVRKSVNELIQAKPNDAMGLERQPKGAKAKLFVLQAELVDYKDLALEAENLKQACDKTKAELDKAKMAWKSVRDEAESAMQAAAVATEKAEKAQDEAEAANLAVSMAQAAIG